MSVRSKRRFVETGRHWQRKRPVLIRIDGGSDGERLGVVEPVDGGDIFLIHVQLNGFESASPVASQAT